MSTHRTTPLRAAGAPLAFGTVALAAAPAHAMHIADGVMPVQHAGFWWLVALPVLVLALRRLRRQSHTDGSRTAVVALMGAAVLAVSSLPLPVPLLGSTSHPCGTGMAAALIGPWPTVVITSVVLTLQALFLGHGGLTTLGAGVVSMGLVGGGCGYLTFVLARRLGRSPMAAAFGAGVVGSWATYACTAVQLALALHPDGQLAATFATVVMAFAPLQIPIGLVEGVAAAFAFRYVQQRRPDLLGLVLRESMP